MTTAAEPVGGPTTVSLDERFADCVNPTATLWRLHTGCEWAEGPVWVPAARHLLWSDIPNDRVLRWDERSGLTDVWEAPAGFPNGRTLDGLGRVVACEHGGRRVARHEHDGSVTTVAEAFGGRRLNSPNDVVVRSDGSTWFTDPTYGIDSDYEGHRAASEVGASRLYRVDPASGAVHVATEELVRPNGLAFSLDERRLYVTDTGATHVPGGPRHVRAFDVADDLSLSGGAVLAESTAGLFDGLRVDGAGRLWVAAGDGVHCHDADGTLLGKVLVPETTSNVAFGGVRRNRLFITATTSLYAIALRWAGAPLPVDRRTEAGAR